MRVMIIRAHHLLCLLDALASGPSQPRLFGEHLTLNQVARRLRDEPATMVCVNAGPDDICLPCPWWSGQGGHCLKEPERAASLDEARRGMDMAMLEVLAWPPGRTASAIDLYREIAAGMNGEILAGRICLPCPDAGTCAARFAGAVAAVLGG
jgi:hypothetical protein